MDVEPVAGDVDNHGELEEEDEAGVEGCEGRQETHSGTSIRQHVQHGAELAALLQRPGHVAVQGVQEGGEDVAAGGQAVAGGHEPETEESQQYPGVSDQVGDEQEDILTLASERFLKLGGHHASLSTNNLQRLLVC